MVVEGSVDEWIFWVDGLEDFEGMSEYLLYP